MQNRTDTYDPPITGSRLFGRQRRTRKAKTIEQNERSSEKTVPEPPPSAEHSLARGAALRDDVIAAAIGTLIAAPLCDASWHAIVTEARYTRGIIGLLVGIPAGIAGFTYHWWKSKLLNVARYAIIWGPLAILLAFAYVAGPEMYRRATEPRLSPPPPAVGYIQKMGPISTLNAFPQPVASGGNS